MHRRASMVFAIVTVVGVLRASPARADDGEAERVRAAVDALALIGEIDDGPTPVVVRGTVRGKKATAMLTVARQIYADVDRRFVRDRSGTTPPVTLCLAATEADYTRLVAAFDDDAPSALGFYRGDLRVAVVNLARGVGNLRHELVHPLLGDDFPAIPPWLNEGLGALYGTAKTTKAGVEPLVNYRLADLQRALRAGTLPTLDELVDSTYAEVHGDRAMTFYAMGRYVMLYLHRRGRLDATYAALRDAAGDAAAQKAVLAAEIDEEAFHDWASALRHRSR